MANIISGILLTYTRAFQLGDRVNIGETTGDVLERRLLVTKIRTTKNEDVTIPNSLVLGGHIINYSSSARENSLILHTKVTIGYDVPWRTIHSLLLNAAKRTQNILQDPPPFVLQTALDDFYVCYELNVYTREASLMPKTYAELHQNIQDQFNDAGIQIMSPHYENDPSEIKIPKEFRNKGKE